MPFDWNLGSPAVDDETVYLSDTNGDLAVVDRDTGVAQSLIDVVTFDHPRSPTAPLLVDGLVYVGYSTDLFVVDPTLGVVTNRIETNRGMESQCPAYVDDTLYLGTRAGALEAIDADRVRPTFSRELPLPDTAAVDEPVDLAADVTRLPQPETTGDATTATGEDADTVRLTVDGEPIAETPVSADDDAAVLHAEYVHERAVRAAELVRVETDDDATGVADTASRSAMSVLPLAPEDRLTYGGDYRRHNQIPGPIPTEPAEPIWTFDTDDTLRSMPTVVDRTAYVGARDRRLFAFDVDEGALNRETAIGDDLRESVTAHDDRLYVASHEMVATVDRATGDVEWATTLEVQVRMSPVVFDEFVVVKSTYDAGNDPTHVELVVLNREDGTVLWTRNVDDGWIGTPSVAGELLIVSTADHVYGVDLQEGDARWRTQVPGTDTRPVRTVSTVRVPPSDVCHRGSSTCVSSDASTP